MTGTDSGNRRHVFCLVWVAATFVYFYVNFADAFYEAHEGAIRALWHNLFGGSS